MATSMLDVVDGSGEIEKVTVTSKLVEINKDEDTDTLNVKTEIVETSEIKDLMENGKEDTDEIITKVEEKKLENSLVKDPDFYTRSMDLSDKDFEMSEEFKEDKVPTPLKIVIVLILIFVILLGIFLLLPIQEILFQEKD